MDKLLLVIIMLTLSACSNSINSNIDHQNKDLKVGHSLGCHQTDFIEPSLSEYILPYEVGESFTVSQGVCGGVTHVKDYGQLRLDNRYAYDFDLPVGTNIIASRSGEVINVEDFYSNKTLKIDEINFIFIRHDDGTVAIYNHLSPKGALVSVGDRVNQGDIIGISGNSGFSWVPHLHFDVRKETKKCKLDKLKYTGSLVMSIRFCPTVPVAFKNAIPRDGVLIEGQEYIAAKY